MKVVETSGAGGPEVLKLGERAVPVPGPGEVLVKVAAAGVNRPDLLQRLGKYPPPAGITDVIGLEIAGTIVEGDTAHADNTLGLAVGSPVCALVAGGGYAEYALAPVAQCLPIPTGLSMVEAAALPETFFTVWSNVFDRGGLGRGPNGKEEVLLVQGGASGIGVAAIQMARALGHRVIATAGTDDKCRACKDLGADVAINYKTQDFAAECKAATGGRGVDVVLDMVAGDYLNRELTCLADDGRIVVIALLGGATASIDASQILRRRLTITGSALRPRSVAFKGAIARSLHQHVWPLVGPAAAIRPVIHATFPAAQAAEAHAELERGQHVGKIVLLWE
jgi:NADPH2:quinone reductase